MIKFVLLHCETHQKNILL